MSSKKRSGGSGGGEEHNKRRQGDDRCRDDRSVNQQILEALRTQNSLLRSIDASLGRIERQDQGRSHQQRQLSQHQQSHSAAVTSLHGSWKFVEAQEATQKRVVYKTSAAVTSFASYKPAQLALFGRVEDEGGTLVGEIYPVNVNEFHNPYPSSPIGSYDYWHPHYSIDGYTPSWGGANASARNLLTHLLFNDKAELNHKSGVYSLTIKYNIDDQPNVNVNQEAGIIIGEVEFRSNGYAMAEGADWDRLLNNQRQTRLPYAHGARGNPTWLRRKITEPWKDGDELQFRIDTNENTIVFQKGDMPQKSFWNILAFTNNRTYPDFLRAFAYCGGVDDSQQNHSKRISVKLTIVP